MAGGGTAPRLVMILVAGLVWVLVLAGAAHAEGPDEFARLRDEVLRLYEQGKYDKAVPIGERVIAPCS